MYSYNVMVSSALFASARSKHQQGAQSTDDADVHAGLVELRRIAEQGLAIRRFGQNERLGDSTIRRG
jgi:hypothetical protein